MLQFPEPVEPDKAVEPVKPVSLIPAFTPSASLADCDLSADLAKKEYQRFLKDAQKQLFAAYHRALSLRIPVVLVFEGWDAAGKGGVIKRICEHLDPRNLHVYPTRAPSADELSHHYLRRFWLRLPQRGQLAIFDRSWYGRVLVERIEGFCSQQAWQRAYAEINHFEQMLSDDGALVRKYFLHMHKDVQLERFQARQDDPLKRWKLTEEDWRNRERWEDYEVATEEMLQRTHQTWAPWTVVASNSKRWARVAVISHLAEAIHAIADSHAD